MFIFERLITRNYDTVCYVIKCREKDIFNFYTQNDEIMDTIFNAENSIDEMLNIYIANFGKLIGRYCRSGMIITAKRKV